MPTNHYSVSALPAGATAADKSLLRAGLVTRNLYCLTSAEDSRDLVAIDPDGGGTIPGLVQNGLVFQHDPLDTTTAHDAVTCLVSYDSQRYKLETGLHAPFSVLDKDLTAPPTSPSPSYGDSYLIYGSPTGDWVGKSGYIAIYTARGWEFALPPVGFLVFAEDENSYYHRDSLGAWTLGVGTRTLGDNSVTPANLINRPIRWYVINQTTTVPPTSPAPSTGDAYIIGAGATGTWSGKDAKIALCEDGSTFTIYTPRVGDLAYDVANNIDYRFTGSAWVSAAGVIVGRSSVSTTSGSTSTGGSSFRSYSDTVAPTITLAFRKDTATISYAAKRVGATLKFKWFGRVAAGGDNAAYYEAALFVDSNTSASDWHKVSNFDSTKECLSGMYEFEVTAADASSHTYYFAFINSDSASSTVAPAMTRRRFEVQEFS